MSRFLLQHQHKPIECRTTFASFQGSESPVRRRAAIASCRFGGHCVWWTVDAASEQDALAQLPPYVAQRTVVTTVTDVLIP
jgi:hypothetical protein